MLSRSESRQLVDFNDCIDFAENDGKADFPGFSGRLWPVVEGSRVPSARSMTSRMNSLDFSRLIALPIYQD
jgi:hypothetical protein